ncbi:arrestin domain-containing protein 3-like [Centroberyx gerrardi]
MFSPVKSFTVSCKPINAQNTFTSGDSVSGEITLELTKECKINSLSVKLKGKAEVKWTEGAPQYGSRTYYAKDKYFSTDKFIIESSDKDSGVIAPGLHTYPFTFQIPDRNLPSSFDFGFGCYGKILYTLQARLSRPMRPDNKATAKLNFVSTNLDSKLLMTAQHETKDKKMKFFSSGTITMDVNIERMGYYQGEGVEIVSYIQNKSSREIKPKYLIYRKHSFFAEGKRKVHTRNLLKEVGEPVPPSTSQTVAKIITIPPDTPMSILNCNIIKSEYRLQVYLDVKLDTNPEIKFPLVILPAAENPSVQQPPHQSGFGCAISEDQPGWSSTSQYSAASESSAPPPPYGQYAMYPSLPSFGEKS